MSPVTPAGGRFETPWQLRAYALAAALEEAGALPADALPPGASSAAWPVLLERLLVDGGHLSPTEIDAEVAHHAAQASRDAHP